MIAKTKITGLVMVLMALSAPMVWADSGAPAGAAPDTSSHQGANWHHGGGEHMFAKILNLSDDQVKQLKDLREKDKTAMKSIFDQMKSNREAFNAEIVKAAPDMAKINDIQTQIKTIQSQMVDAHLNSLLEVKKILTPEQFAGYMALKKEREMKMKMMMRHGHGKDHGAWGGKGDEDHDSDSQE